METKVESTIAEPEVATENMALRWSKTAFGWVKNTFKDDDDQETTSKEGLEDVRDWLDKKLQSQSSDGLESNRVTIAFTMILISIKCVIQDAIQRTVTFRQFLMNGQFKLPSTPTVLPNITKNLELYFGNYLWTTIIILVIATLLTGIALPCSIVIPFLILFMCRVVSKRVKFSFKGFQFTFAHQKKVIAIMWVLLLLYHGLVSTLMGGLVFSVIVNLIHAVLYSERLPEEAKQK